MAATPPRHVRRSVAALGGLACAVSFVACSGGGDDAPSTRAATATTPASSAAATSSPTPSPTEARVEAEVLPPLVDDATVSRIGRADADSAWEFSSDLGSMYGYDPALMKRPVEYLEPEDFAGLRSAMSPTQRKAWDRAVRDVADIESFRTVNGLATVGVNVNGYRLRSTKPVTGFTIVGGVLAFDDGEVVTTQTQTAVLHLTDGSGKPVKYTSVRTVTLTLGREGDDWTIEDWESEAEPYEVVADRSGSG